jgi:hypothetical protein
LRRLRGRSARDEAPRAQAPSGADSSFLIPIATTSVRLLAPAPLR